MLTVGYLWLEPELRQESHAIPADPGLGDLSILESLDDDIDEREALAA